MEIKENEILEQPVKKKRGRKPGKNKKIYFSTNEENAVVDYINATTKEEKDIIFKTILYPAFKKMVECIMRRYHLEVPNEDSGTTFNDTLSFIVSKADKFNPDRDKKAYSYYSNVCKNYIIGKIANYNKGIIRNPSYDTDEYDVTNDIRYSNYPDKGAIIASEIVEKLMLKIREMLEHSSDYALKPNEIKLGNALLVLLDNWDDVISTDGSNKLNKDAILFFLREKTGLDTKGIRDNLKKYRKEYLIVKKVVID